MPCGIHGVRTHKSAKYFDSNARNPTNLTMQECMACFDGHYQSLNVQKIQCSVVYNRYFIFQAENKGRELPPIYFFSLLSRLFLWPFAALHLSLCICLLHLLHIQFHHLSVIDNRSRVITPNYTPSSLLHSRGC